MTRSTWDQKAHSHEGEYFRRRELQALEQYRNRERGLAEIRALVAQTGVSGEVAVSLVSLGFTVDRFAALSLLPAVWTAWAEEVLTGRERDRVMELAGASGIEPQSPALVLVTEWLEQKPDDTYFVQALAALAAVLRELPPQERARRVDEMLECCGEVARASGGIIGFFGLGSRVCEEEHAVISRISSVVGRPTAEA